MEFKEFKYNRRIFSPQAAKKIWKCSNCGQRIIKLFFEPNPDKPIYCRKCWIKKLTERAKNQ